MFLDLHQWVEMHKTKGFARHQANRAKSRAGEHSAEEGPNIFLKLVTTERVNQNFFPFSHRSVGSDNTGFCMHHSGRVCVGLPIHDSLGLSFLCYDRVFEWTCIHSSINFWQNFQNLSHKNRKTFLYGAGFMHMDVMMPTMWRHALGCTLQDIFSPDFINLTGF